MYFILLLVMLYFIVIPLFLFLLYKVNYLGINKSKWSFVDFYYRYIPIKIYHEFYIPMYFIIASGTVLWISAYLYLKNKYKFK